MLMKFLTRFFLLALTLSACGPVTPFNTEMLPTPVPQEYQDFSYQIVWSRDDSMIALTTNTGLYVYDTKSYEQIAAFDELGGSTAVFSNRYLATVTNKKLFVWNVKDFSLLFTKDAENETHFQTAAISPDDNILVTADQKQTRYWSLPDGKLMGKVTSTNFITDMAFSGNDTLIIADPYLGLVQEWDVQNQEKIRAFGVSKPAVNFNLSQDGKLVVVDYGDYGFETWDVEAGKLHHEYTDIIGAPGWNNLSGDHNTVVVWGYGVGEESGLSVWDLSQHKKISEFSIPIVNGDGWRSGALNSDGTILAASNNEGFIYFYDLNSGKKIGEIYLPYKFDV
jgi:WD40 repeat protein